MAFSRTSRNGSREIGQKFLSSLGSAEGFFRRGFISARFHCSGKEAELMDMFRTFVSSVLIHLLPRLKTWWAHGSFVAP